MDSWRQLRLPSDLCANIEEQLRGSQFKDLEEFLTFVLRELASRNSSRIEEQEREIIERRLRDLGYM